MWMALFGTVRNRVGAQEASRASQCPRWWPVEAVLDIVKLMGLVELAVLAIQGVCLMHILPIVLV